MIGYYDDNLMMGEIQTLDAVRPETHVMMEECAFEPSTVPKVVSITQTSVVFALIILALTFSAEGIRRCRGGGCPHRN